LQIAVGIASSGRPDILAATLERLLRQRRRAARTIVSLAAESDLADAERFRAMGVEIVTGLRGLTRQRNALLALARDCDLIAFFDDDFVPCDDYLAEAASLFGRRERVALATGEVIADGISSAGLSFPAARELLQHAPNLEDADEPVRHIYNGYGCNMVVALAPVRAHALRFDERLPLYGWLEDVDFSRQLASYGDIVHARRLRGVHLGAKRGRQSGRKLGYSQIANPVYLMLKRTLSGDRALWLICRNIGMNVLRSMKPEPYIDRRGRLAGNVYALLDLLRLRLDPENVLRM
jgi:GT2 family glycosyltransferase